MTEKCSVGYLVARRIHRLCPTINVSAINAPAKMKTASATSKNHVLLSMAISIYCQPRGRYGVFTPADNFSGARIKWRSTFNTIIVCGIETSITDQFLPKFSGADLMKNPLQTFSNFQNS